METTTTRKDNSNKNHYEINFVTRNAYVSNLKKNNATRPHQKQNHHHHQHHQDQHKNICLLHFFSIYIDFIECIENFTKVDKHKTPFYNMRTMLRKVYCRPLHFVI